MDQHLLYGYKGDTLIIAQYGIHAFSNACGQKGMAMKNGKQRAEAARKIHGKHEFRSWEHIHL